jgi:drug/metabolite transporter (DMT)-like permease
MTTPAIPPASNTPASNTPAVPSATGSTVAGNSSAGNSVVVSTAPKRSAAPSVIALFLVILGGIALPVGLIGGVIRLINDGGNGPGGFIALFVAGIVAIIVGFLIGLVNLIRGPHRVLSVFPVIIPLIPVITVIALVSNARH